MHDVAEILAGLLILFLKTQRYAVCLSGFCGINIIYYIFGCIFRDVKISKRRFLYFKSIQTEISFWGEHVGKKFIQRIYLFASKSSLRDIRHHDFGQAGRFV